ncbi:hypothetical protein HKX48_004952 [Thoreauomyces humboldtii]|nr:hypothetical protein HKX48_004952 [Thoreauomyces humboldtii]
MDDFHKFYIVWSVAGVFEGKTDILLWDGSPWTWTHDVQVKSAFLADLYDKPTTISLFEIVRPTDKLGAIGGETGLFLKQMAEGGETFGSRLRMSANVTPDYRKLSMSALAKRQINLASAALPVRERYTLVQRASALGYGVADLEPTVPSERPGSGGDAARRKLTTWQDSSEDEASLRPPVSKRKGGKAVEPPPEPISRVTSARPRSSVGSRASSPRRRQIFENPDGTILREPPQPHHFDRPDRHLLSSARSREQAAKRVSPDSSIGSPERSRSPERAKTPDNPRLSIRDRPPPAPEVKPKSPLSLRPLPGPRAKPNRGPPPVAVKTQAKALGPSRGPSARVKKVEIKHELRARIELDVSDLFWGSLNVAGETQERIEGLNFCRVNMTLSAPLLSKAQEESLNPLSITVLSAESMPDKPMPYSELSRLCNPIFTRFHFFSDPHTHQSVTSQPRGRRTAFNTRHLVLAGLLDEDALREDLLRKKLTIQIHDRELKVSKELQKMEQDFGGFTDTATLPSGPFGVATFSLQELATGATNVEMITPILPGRDKRGRKSPLYRPLPAGFWLEAGAMLSIRVEAKYPVLANSGALSGGIFERVVIVTSAKDQITPVQLQLATEQCNAKALQLVTDADNSDPGLARAALLKHSWKEEDSGDAELDIITGHHIFDGQYRILLLEGLVEGSLKNILGSLRSPASTPLYVYSDPDTTYGHRLWGADPLLVHTRLAHPIRDIVERTEMYLRMRTSEECFQGLQALASILDLGASSVGISQYPTRDMIRAFTYSYGVTVPPNTMMDSFGSAALKGVMESQGLKNANTPGEHLVANTSQLSSRTTLATCGSRPMTLAERNALSKKRVDDTNEMFTASLAHRSFRQPNFVAINLKQFGTSKAAEPYERGYDTLVHNYSIQRFSTTAEQLETLRWDISQDPDHVYSFGGTYLSQVVPRVDYDVALREMADEDRRRWRTEEGFVVPSKAHRSLIASE